MNDDRIARMQEWLATTGAEIAIKVLGAFPNRMLKQELGAFPAPAPSQNVNVKQVA